MALLRRCAGVSRNEPASALRLERAGGSSAKGEFSIDLELDRFFCMDSFFGCGEPGALVEYQFLSRAIAAHNPEADTLQAPGILAVDFDMIV